MILHSIIQIIFVVTGSIAIIASLLDCDWFFTTKNAEFAVKKLGRTGARILYGATGFLFIAAAVFFYYRVEALK